MRPKDEGPQLENYRVSLEAQQMFYTFLSVTCFSRRTD